MCIDFDKVLIRCPTQVLKELDSILVQNYFLYVSDIKFAPPSN
jgi:hypothetical protein